MRAQSHVGAQCGGRDLTQAFVQCLHHARSPAADSPTARRPTLSTLYAHSPREQALLAQRAAADAQWFAEARRVHDTIASLLELLVAVRRPYLAPPAPPASSGHRSTTPTTTALSSTGDGLADARARWGVSDRLSDTDRDQVDTHVRLTIKKTMDRIQELEKAERLRQRSWVSSSDGGLLSIFSKPGGVQPSSDSGPFSDAYSNQLCELRYAICASLSVGLAAAGNRQRSLQEQRLANQQKRLVMTDMAAASAPRASAINSATAAPIKGTTRTLKSGISSSAPLPVDGDGSKSSPAALADTVSSEQALLFDSENAALLTTLQADLAAVEAAEQKLRDISELQTQLIQHLGQQNEMTNMLLDDSQAHTMEVTRGNTQLSQAQRNSRQATKLLCAFLIGSGCSLLFLHCTYCGRALAMSSLTCWLLFKGSGETMEVSIELARCIDRCTCHWAEAPFQLFLHRFSAFQVDVL